MTLPTFVVSEGSALSPQVSEQSDSTTIYQYMVDGKEKAEEEWTQQQEEDVSARVENEQEKQIQQHKAKVKAKKKAEAKKKKLKAKAIKLATKRIAAARKEAAKFGEVANKKAKAAKKAAQQNGTSENLGNGTSYSIGSGGNSAVKTWMGYLAITSTSSPQYKLQHSQAYTGKYGIRMVGNRYCIAVGSHYCSTIGTKIDVVLSNGNTIPCILGDQKSDKHTDATNSYHAVDGSYVEFIVDTSALDSSAKVSGNCSSISEFAGTIDKIIVYN
jgi:hypothetical protein